MKKKWNFFLDLQFNRLREYLQSNSKIPIIHAGKNLMQPPNH